MSILKPASGIPNISTIPAVSTDAAFATVGAAGDMEVVKARFDTAGLDARKPQLQALTASVQKWLLNAYPEYQGRITNDSSGATLTVQMDHALLSTVVMSDSRSPGLLSQALPWAQGVDAECGAVVDAYRRAPYKVAVRLRTLIGDDIQGRTVLFAIDKNGGAVGLTWQLED